MTSLPHRLDRSVEIRASRETVFRFFTDSARWATWWGSGSTIEARPGGRVRICYPGGVEVSGEVLDVRAPEQIVFTYGYTSGKPIPAGSSRVTIRLESAGTATRVQLAHEFAEADVRDQHVQGWRYQLSLFGNVVCDEVHAGAAAVVDAWFGAWAEPNQDACLQILSGAAASDVRFRDRFSLVDGLADLVPHIGAAQRFMPGIRMQRRGAIRHCQGTVLADWVWTASDGQQRASGTNVFGLGPDGRIESVTGFMNASETTT